MSPVFPLHIFPPGLDHSILVAVWLGVLILTFMTEAFGWGFLGLVVPGYLASILISRPVSGLATLVEIVLTWAMLRAHLDGLPRLRILSPSFGRERFFVVVLWGTAIRILCEAWIFPALWSALPQEVTRGWGLEVWRPDFYGIGLVLVPLAANVLWRNGLLRGGGQLALAALLTFLGLRFLLLPFTNLSLSEFQLLYEDAAVSLLKSPKVYIILLVGAMAAASANKRWGWDFGGILVPALLGVAWLDPPKVPGTLAEVVVVVVVARVLLKLPFTKALAVEGPRRVAVIFTLGLAYKTVLAWVAPSLNLTMRTTDLFGFGYLLPSLLATKVWVRKDMLMVVVPTLVVSIFSFLMGSLVTFGLTLLPLPGTLPPPDVVTGGLPYAFLDAPVSTPEDIARRAVVMLDTSPRVASESWEQALVLTGLLEATDGLGKPGQATDLWARRAGPTGMRLQTLAGPWGEAALVEPEEHLEDFRGIGSYLFESKGRSLVLFCPPGPPGESLDRAGVAAWLYPGLKARWLVLPGGRSEPKAGVIPAPSVRAAWASLAHRPWLVVAVNPDRTGDGLYLRGELPAELDLKVLRGLLGPLELHWSEPPRSVAGWLPEGKKGVVTLYLSAARWSEVLSRAMLAEWDEPELWRGVQVSRASSGATKADQGEDTGQVTPGAEAEETPVKPGLEAAVPILAGADESASAGPLGAGGGLASVRAEQTQALSLLAQAAGLPQGRPVEVTPGSVESWLQARIDEVARPATARYLPPTELRLLQWRLGVLMPLLRTLRWGEASKSLILLEELAPMARVAHALGYRVELLHFPGEELMVALVENAPLAGHSGTLLLRPSAPNNYVVEVPEPALEGMPQLGMRWFQGLEARALLIAGASRSTRESRIADPLALEAPPGLFATMHQALVSAVVSPELAPVSILLQSAAAGRPMPADVALATQVLLTRGGPMPEWVEPLEERLHAIGISLARVEGDAWSANLRLPPGGVPRYSSLVGEQRLAGVWVSRPLRQLAAGGSSRSFLLAAQSLTLEPQILDLEKELVQALEKGKPVDPRALAEERERVAGVLSAWRSLSRYGGAGQIQRLLAQAIGSERRVRLVKDPLSGGTFLLSQPRHGSGPTWCLNLDGASGGDLSVLPTLRQVDKEQIRRFIRSFRPILWLEPTPVSGGRP